MGGRKEGEVTSLLGPVLRDLEDVLELKVSAVVVVNKLYRKQNSK